MLALDVLRVPFARAMDFRLQMPGVGAPIIRLKPGESTGLQQGVELQKNLIFTAPKDVGSPLAGVVIDGMPEPAGVAFVADTRPHLIPLRLRFPRARAGHRHVVWGVGA